MANQITIDIGAAANDGTGDPLRTAFNYVNNNFSNVWNTGLPNSNVQFSDNRILTVNTNANLVLAPNGIAKVVSNVSILPNISNVHSVGSDDRRWNTIYAQYLNVSNDITFGDLTVDGNLTVNGNIIEIGNIVTDSKTIQLANTANTVGAANGSGITVGASDNIATLLYNSTSNVWTTNIGVSVTGNVTGNYILGNGALLTGLAATYGNADVAAYLPTYTGNLSAGNAAITNLTSSNLVNARTGTFTGDQFSDGAMYVGTPAGTVLGSDVVIQITANSGSYSQTNFQNINPGVTASSDYILTANNGNNTSRYLDIGITSSGWDGSETNVLANLVANNGYLYVQDGNLTVGTRAGNVSYGWNFDTTGNLTVPGNIIPRGNNTQSLGSATKQWNDLYLSNATIYMNSVPISLTSGNVLTVNGADVVTTAANGESNIGNLDILGTTISIAAGAPETYINLSASVGGWAYIQVPTDATANVYNTRIHNDAGNIEFGTGDYSTGATGYIWVLGNDGNLVIPGIISSSNTIALDNRASSNTADIQLYSADDILVQGRDKPNDLEAEGGDINIYGGIGSAAVTGGNDTGGGGDIQIRGGTGGGGEVTSTGGGSGGFVTIAGGDGGTSIDSNAGSGGTVNITAGSAPGAASTAVGGFGGGVNISAGDTTRINESGGAISLNTGSASGDGTGTAGYVEINIPSSNVGPGGTWTFGGTGTTLNVPGNAEIYGANFGNLTVGCAGNTIVTSSDYGANVKNWVFGYTGNLIIPGEIQGIEGTAGGVANIRGGFGTAGPGGDVYVVGGASGNGSSEFGNVIVGAGVGAWTFDNTGMLTVPGEGVINSVDDTVTLRSFNTSTGNANSVYLGTSGGLGFNDQAAGGNWLEIFRSGIDPQLSTTGNLLITADSTNTAPTWTFSKTGNLTLPGNISGNTAGYAIGYRDIPQVSFTGNTTIATTDAGKHYYSTQSTSYILTIANNASQGFQVGSAITIVNQGTGNITVAQGSGVTLYIAGNATSGNRTVSTFGMATLIKVATNTWFISGAGVA